MSCRCCWDVEGPRDCEFLFESALGIDYLRLRGGISDCFLVGFRILAAGVAQLVAFKTPSSKSLKEAPGRALLQLLLSIRCTMCSGPVCASACCCWRRHIRPFSCHLELRPSSFSGLGWNFLAFFDSGFESVLPPILPPSEANCWRSFSGALPSAILKSASLAGLFLFFSIEFLPPFELVCWCIISCDKIF